MLGYIGKSSGLEHSRFPFSSDLTLVFTSETTQNERQQQLKCSSGSQSKHRTAHVPSQS